jgi:hypothetical protein
MQSLFVQVLQHRVCIGKQPPVQCMKKPHAKLRVTFAFSSRNEKCFNGLDHGSPRSAYASANRRKTTMMMYAQNATAVSAMDAQ